ncbi:MAG: hypothetical protein EBY55_02935 [Gammaproteobacteria bacterium]|nr:hypothetical protein [Gammaproteobacteria bacterium]
MYHDELPRRKWHLRITLSCVVKQQKIKNKRRKQKTKTKIEDNHHPIVTLPTDTKGRKLNEGRMKGQMKIERK